MVASLCAIVLACTLAELVAAELHPLSDAYIDYINSKQITWKAGRNFPRQTPMKHIKGLLGALPRKGDSPLPSVKHDADLIASLPENFDARKEWPNCPSISEIRDQGSCGSCWAFGAVEAMTDRVCIHSNGMKQFHFSAEDLISCCTGCGFGCRGGFPDEAWVYWAEHGIVSGGNYNSSQGCKPYFTPPCVHHIPGQKVNATGNKLPCFDTSRKTPKCSTTCDNSYHVDYENNKFYGKEPIVILDGEDHIKAELFQNGPVEALFLVYPDFYSYKRGVYFPIGDESDVVGGHAVKMIGWGVENGTKYWLVANSWNSGWGDNGFFKVGRGSNVCEIEDMIVAGTPLFPSK